MKDIDWPNGAVCVAGKGRRERRLPLPADVGAALVATLRSRPPTNSPDVIFVTALPPCIRVTIAEENDRDERALPTARPCADSLDESPARARINPLR